MTTYKPLLLLSLLMLNFAACTFSPEEMYEVDIDPPADVPDIRIELDLYTDTVYMDNESRTVVSPEIDGNKVHSIEVYVGGTLIDRVYYPNEELDVWLNYGLESNTYYHMNFVFYVATGTGSMADSLKAEAYLMSYECEMMFVDSKDLASRISSQECVNGKLRMHWTKFKGAGFKRYILIHGLDGWVARDTVAYIYDRDINYAYDETYVGYRRPYYVITETSYTSYLGKYIYSNEDLPQIQVEKKPGGLLQFTWEKSNYSNNAVGYKLYEHIRDVNSEEVVEIASTTDTSLLYEKGRFMKNARYYLHTVPKVEPPEIIPSNLSAYTTETQAIDIGDPITINRNSRFNAPLGKCCYFLGGHKLIKFDCETQSDISNGAVPSLDMNVSPDGRYIISREYNDQNEIVIYNSEDLSVYRRYAFSDLLPESEGVKYLAISNNGIIALASGLRKIYIYNIHTDKNLYQHEVSNMLSFWSPGIKISPNGDYLLLKYSYNSYSTLKTALLKIGSSFTERWSGDVDFYQFDDVNQSFSYYQNKTLYTRSLSSLSIVKQYRLQDRMVFNIDYNNDEFVSINWDKDIIKIYDFNTGEVKREVPTDDDVSGDALGFNVYLSNKTIFSDDDLKVQLEY